MPVYFPGYEWLVYPAAILLAILILFLCFKVLLRLAILLAVVIVLWAALHQLGIVPTPKELLEQYQSRSSDALAGQGEAMDYWCGYTISHECSSSCEQKVRSRNARDRALRVRPLHDLGSMLSKAGHLI